MAATVTPIDDTLFKALGDFIESVIACPTIQGLVNRTAMPIGGFIAMTTLKQRRLSTNTKVYSDSFTSGIPTGTKAITQATEWVVQIDCYGGQSMQWANILTTLFRDEFSCTALKPHLQPLDADDPVPMPLVNGEQQYEQRWVVTAKFQYNPTTIISQQFFDQAVVEGIHSVDAETL